MRLYFKATRRAASSCDGYRQIAKRGDGLICDQSAISDDVIHLRSLDGEIKIGIDCDKKTGEFCLFFDEDKFKKDGSVGSFMAIKTNKSIN